MYSAAMDVLIVDDDEETRRHVAEGLVAAGHQISEARTAASAMAQASAKRFDVIVLDRLLPDREGTQVVRELRRRGDLTPVLMLTAVGDVDARVQGIEAGA